MFTRRSILFFVLLVPRLLAHGADANGALERYHARLDEIARSYKQEFAEIRKGQRRIGLEKANFRAAQRQIEELGAVRNKALAEARLNYEKELKQTDAAPASKVSREERQREFWAARRQIFEDGQKAFWAGLPLRESQYAELLAIRRKEIEEVQTAFWAGLFEKPKTVAQDRPPEATAQRTPNASKHSTLIAAGF